MPVELVASTIARQQEREQIQFAGLARIFDNPTARNLQLKKRWHGVRQTLDQTEADAERCTNQLGQWARFHLGGSTAEVQAWVAGTTLMLEQRTQLLQQISELRDQLDENFGEQMKRQQIIELFIRLAEKQSS